MSANKWSVKNSNGDWWCGDGNEWINEGSSCWGLTGDSCHNILFTKKELKKFIKEEFEVEI